MNEWSGMNVLAVIRCLVHQILQREFLFNHCGILAIPCLYGLVIGQKLAVSGIEQQEKWIVPHLDVWKIGQWCLVAASTR